MCLDAIAVLAGVLFSTAESWGSLVPGSNDIFLRVISLTHFHRI